MTTYVNQYYMPRLKAKLFIRSEKYSSHLRNIIDSRSLEFIVAITMGLLLLESVRLPYLALMTRTMVVSSRECDKKICERHAEKHKDNSACNLS